MKDIRIASVKGLFYPDNCTKLSIYFQKFTEAIVEDNRLAGIKPKAIIAPHAGYIYSGFTANLAYRYLSKSSAKRIVVIGPSHHHYFKGVSGSYYEEYETPCGNLAIDTDYLIKLSKLHPIGFEPKAHQKEHSTEVQMPFIKYYFRDLEVIEVVYGDVSTDTISSIIDTLLSDSDNLIVISSDLSHFYTKTKAKELDTNCLKAIASLDTRLLKECEACGLLGIKAIIKSAHKANLKSYLLDYRTSADYSHDESRVVGYGSAIFY
jgi:AmmeMemoRadiSam system protein B